MHPRFRPVYGLALTVAQKDYIYVNILETIGGVTETVDYLVVHRDKDRFEWEGHVVYWQMDLYAAIDDGSHWMMYYKHFVVEGASVLRVLPLADYMQLATIANEIRMLRDFNEKNGQSLTADQRRFSILAGRDHTEGFFSKKQFENYRKMIFACLVVMGFLVVALVVVAQESHTSVVCVSAINRDTGAEFIVPCGALNVNGSSVAVTNSTATHSTTSGLPGQLGGVVP